MISQAAKDAYELIPKKGIHKSVHNATLYDNALKEACREMENQITKEAVMWCFIKWEAFRDDLQFKASINKTKIKINEQRDVSRNKWDRTNSSSNRST